MKASPGSGEIDICPAKHEGMEICVKRSGEAEWCAPIIAGLGRQTQDSSWACWPASQESKDPTGEVVSKVKN